jgi:hypothetical protein
MYNPYQRKRAILSSKMSAGYSNKEQNRLPLGDLQTMAYFQERLQAWVKLAHLLCV